MGPISTRTQRIAAAVAAATLIAVIVLIALRFRRRRSAGSDDRPAERADGAGTGSTSDATRVGQPAEEHYDDALVAREASAAAAEAAAIGGVTRQDVEDPAMAPVYEAGGGEQDGWEAAEGELVENATHGDGGADPLRDAITPEVESDASGAVYGEADRIPSTEVVEDPGTGVQDPGAGPGLAAERGPGLEPRQDG
jgi:hypothetical protein